jgi:hypothetical protein
MFVGWHGKRKRKGSDIFYKISFLYFNSIEHKKVISNRQFAAQLRLPRKQYKIASKFPPS